MKKLFFIPIFFLSLLTASCSLVDNYYTYLKLTFLEDKTYAGIPNGLICSDYTTELEIIIEDNTVSTQTFSVTESNVSAIKQIDYTF